MDVWGPLLQEALFVLRSESAQLALAGASGAIVAALTEWGGFIALARTVVVGALCAIYLSDLAVPLLAALLPVIKLKEASSVTLSGFIMGIVGIIFIELIIYAMQLRRAALTSQKTNKENLNSGDLDD